MSTKTLGKIVREWKCSNIPNWIEYCNVSEFENGCVNLNYKSTWSTTGRGGFFKSFRAAKMYVTSTITGNKY